MNEGRDCTANGWTNNKDELDVGVHGIHPMRVCLAEVVGGLQEGQNARTNTWHLGSVPGHPEGVLLISIEEEYLIIWPAYSRVQVEKEIS